MERMDGWMPRVAVPSGQVVIIVRWTETHMDVLVPPMTTGYGHTDV